MSLSFKYDEHNKYHRFARSAIIAAASLTTFVIVWWFVAIMANMTALPTPIETWDAFISLLNDGDPLTGASLSTYLSKSFGTFLKGLALAVNRGIEADSTYRLGPDIHSVLRISDRSIIGGVRGNILPDVNKHDFRCSEVGSYAVGCRKDDGCKSFTIVQKGRIAVICTIHNERTEGRSWYRMDVYRCS